ncbi:MAG: hypothetical protein U0354_20865 [Candidatus Sericytochromatia bacterium]
MKIEKKKTNELLDAEILQVKTLAEVPLKKNGWAFNWQKLYKEQGFIYKLVIENNPDEIQGVMKFSIKNDEMVYLENIEIAPHNIGSNGKYDLVAGSLLAFCCKQSFILGKNAYNGVVVFDSKTVLIDFYKQKYGATLLFDRRMCFYPDISQKLINRYLKG